MCLMYGPAPQVAGAWLGFLHFQLLPQAGGGARLAGVSLDGGHCHGSLASLPHLLAAVVPDGTPLCCLRLGHFRLDPAGLRGCSQLAPLTSLTVEGCGCGGAGAGAILGVGIDLAGPAGLAALFQQWVGSLALQYGSSSDRERLAAGMGDALAAMLEQAPQLEELDLTGSLGGVLPGCVLGATGLRRLALCSNQLSQLPAGPVLSGAGGNEMAVLAACL